MENVDAIINKQNRPHLDRFIINLNRLGYTSSWSILNAKDYGVAQNRKRFFMVSTLDKGEFMFPEKKILTKRLKDYLESEVPESFYLSPEKVSSYETHKKKCIAAGNGFGYRLLDPERERVAFSITTKPDRAISNFIVEHPKSDGQQEAGLIEREDEDARLIIDGHLPDMKTLEQHQRVYDPNGIAPTLFTPHGSDKSPKIIVSGLLTDTGYEKAQRVYDPNGISPALQSRDGKEPVKIIVEESEDEPRIIIAGDLHLEKNVENGKRNNHANDVLDPNGISTCLVAAMGVGGGHVPKIIERGGGPND